VHTIQNYTSYFKMEIRIVDIAKYILEIILKRAPFHKIEDTSVTCTQILRLQRLVARRRFEPHHRWRHHPLTPLFFSIQKTYPIFWRDDKHPIFRMILTRVLKCAHIIHVLKQLRDPILMLEKRE